MATASYYTWVSKGRPWELAAPCRSLRDMARAAGVPILGTIGDESHLTSNLPQDHTPFSATAWPVPLPAYIVCAIDLVDGPWSDRLLAMARSGRAPWLKYMNFRGSNYALSRGWSPVSNGDTHLHISVRTDFLNVADIQNPFVGGSVDLNAVGQIIPGLSNAQVLSDIWKWLATLRFGDMQPRGDDRFQSPTLLGKIKEELDAVSIQMTDEQAEDFATRIGALLESRLATIVQENAFIAVQRGEKE